VIDWKMKRKIVITVLCCVVYQYCAQSLERSGGQSLKGTFTGLLVHFLEKLVEQRQKRLHCNTGLEQVCISFVVWPLNASDIRSLDFVINQFLMKLFKTTDTEIIKYLYIFRFDLPSIRLSRKQITEGIFSFVPLG